MLFNSYEFLFAFLPVTAVGFYVLAAVGNRNAAIAWLVAASLFFYGWWNPAFLGLIGFSIVFNYVLGRSLTRAYTGDGNGHASALLALGVAVNLGLIGYFKYAGFLAETAGDVLDMRLALGDITLPLAISFFTFQQIAYLVDVRRGITSERSFLRYCLFVVFFPQLIAGPIVHHKEVLPQFARSETFRLRAANIAVGLTILSIGLFKKVVIADSLAETASPAFAAAEGGAPIEFFHAWAGVVAYSLQIYFDFSGYSDMAIGLARLFGIRLPVNFAAPYRASSIIDFWRRWHITLSRFLRDYLYIPLGGSRRGMVRRYANVMITMLLGGLWHGAGWPFVLWGGAHGVMLVANHIWRRLFPRRIDRWWSVAVARAVTFLAVTLAWIPFRAETLDGAAAMVAAMTNLPGALQPYLRPLDQALMALGFRFQGTMPFRDDIDTAVWLTILIAFIWTMPTTQQLLARARPAIAMHEADRWRALVQRICPRLVWRPTPLWAGFAACVAVVAILRLTSVSEFLYFRF